jgi:hyperosmotically inducible periplasmic protein
VRSFAACLIFALAAGCGESPKPKPVAAPPQPSTPQPAAPALAPVEPAKPVTAAPEAPKPDPDKALAARVKKALDADSRLNAQGVDVTASHGTVRLWGTVPTAAEQKRARDIAAGVSGVSAVESKIVVVAGS